MAQELVHITLLDGSALSGTFIGFNEVTETAYVQVSPIETQFVFARDVKTLSLINTHKE